MHCRNAHVTVGASDSKKPWIFISEHITIFQPYNYINVLLSCLSVRSRKSVVVPLRTIIHHLWAAFKAPSGIPHPHLHSLWHFLPLRHHQCRLRSVANERVGRDDVSACVAAL